LLDDLDVGDDDDDDDIHSFGSLPYDRSKASSKASSPHSAI
jgi:hypothetical protein